MKILFLTTSEADYLQDSVFHGLRSLYGSDAVDYPKKMILYKGCNNDNIYGRGFTLHNLLEDISVNRDSIKEKVRKDYFDVIFFGSIHRQLELFFELEKYLNKKNTIIMDGEDSPALVPNHRVYKRNPLRLIKRKLYNSFPYYKHEITSETNHYRFLKLIPKSLASKISLPLNLHPVSFSIPEEKIVDLQPIKTKLFPKHIVDEEIAANVKGFFTKYAFDNEKDYYADLQSSRFGMATKRSGWDCLRHYEIAANGVVICFRDLNKKPVTCAPHGLIPGVNCIAYSNYDEVMKQISGISEERYRQIQNESMKWITQNTTISRAKEILNNFTSPFENK